ncbi:MAG: aminotransferase class III-fold pyridoxal phosphate-dependent enzyme [Planctomycetales bacterium]
MVGDLDEVAALIDDETAAILVEPIQGEGGVRIPPDDFLPGLRRLADEHDLLLIFDEVQTVCGRTGHWFGYQHFDVTPDVMTLAKAICGGIAGGAMITKPEIAPSLRPGMHASTFGGNPIAARAGIAVLETIEADGLLENAQRISELFQTRLEAIQQECNLIQEVRVLGLMIGVELSVDGTDVVKQCMDRGLLINCTQGVVLRMLPAMTLAEDEANEGLDILADVLREQVG